MDWHTAQQITTLSSIQHTRWFKYDRDWFVCKQAALRSSCATLREWSPNLHPPSCLGYNLFSPVWELLEWWANRRYRRVRNKALWSNSSLEKTSRPLKFTTDSNNSMGKNVSYKPHCAAAVRPWESEATTSTLPPARVRTCAVLSGSC